MTIPRISLWTAPLELPIRFAAVGFTENQLDNQAKQIQKNNDTVTVTPGAMYILSHVAGRRIAEPVRWVLLDSLNDILAGNLRTEYPERQDLLASTFGEILGAMILALQLEDEVEVVRLLESNSVKTPDFILLEKKSSSSVFGHLLECKGSVLDVNNINQHPKLDVCQHIRGFRSRGTLQLDQIELHKLQPAAGVIIGNADIVSGLTPQMTSKNLSITAIPDGRLTALISPTIRHATRRICRLSNVNCVTCLTAKNSSLVSNATVVLHQKKLKSNPRLNDGLRIFLEEYQNLRRALWAEHDREFVNRANLLMTIRNSLDFSPELKNSFPLIIVPAVEAGIACNLNVSGLNTENLINAIEAIPFESVNIWPSGGRVSTDQPVILSDEEFSLRNIIQHIRTEVSRATSIQGQSWVNRNIEYYEALSEFDEPDTFVGRLNVWRERGRSVKLLTLPRSENTLFSEILLNIQMGVLDRPTRIHTTTEYFALENVTRIRLFADLTFGKAYNDLKAEATRLIANFGRSRHQFIEWRSEYIEYKGRRRELGESWDKHPLPDPSSSSPGITAWISKDGRAEIIVRYE